VFLVERNERGCIVRIEVDDCGGGPQCCQQRQPLARARDADG